MIIGHKKQQEFFENKIKTGQLAHAYLFCGRDGIGKKLFALELAEKLNCRFPDLLVINKESFAEDEEDKERKEISVKQVRKVQEFLSLKSYNSGYRIVIVDNAEQMSAEAQNCFLKTLEEPKGDTLIILVSSQPERMLSTIFSRCQVIKFFATKEILEVAQNPEQKEREKEILDELQKIMKGSLAEKFAYTKNIKEEGGNVLEIMHILQEHFRQELLAGKDVSSKLKLLDDLIYKLSFTNASPKLALEVLLMEMA